ncbi:MAG: DUF2149 domain-containing protein [Methanosarcinales archaeon]|nr:DUF2149 domain-containing protein [Methanosarcinales archaeon]
MNKKIRFMGKKREIEEEDDDPMAGIANLFDVAIIFAVALMVALVTHNSLPELISDENFTIVKNPGTEDMEIIIKEGEKIEIQKITNETMKGTGEKLGTTYLLPNGEVVYVVED